MKDMIDKRNEKEQMGRSIIKRWNVNYMPAPPKPAVTGEEPETMKEPAAMEGYNETTGSYSGFYGQGQVDEVDRRQIEAILSEKSEVIQDIVDKGRNIE